jgi:hypothetical protein
MHVPARESRLNLVLPDDLAGRSAAFAAWRSQRGLGELALPPEAAVQRRLARKCAVIMTHFRRCAAAMVGLKHQQWLIEWSLVYAGLHRSRSADVKESVKMTRTAFILPGPAPSSRVSGTGSKPVRRPAMVVR